MFSVKICQKDANMEIDSKPEKSSTYNAKDALASAVSDWLPEFYKAKLSSGGVSICPVSSAVNCSETVKKEVLPSSESQCQNSGNIIPTKMSDKKVDAKQPKQQDVDRLCVADVVMLCDLFYLPYEHGPHSVGLLKTAHWLLRNWSYLHSTEPWTGISDGDSKTSRRGSYSRRYEWYERAASFHDSYRDFSMVVDRFVNIPNRELLYELYCYVSDMRSSLALLNSYIKWHGNIPALLFHVLPV